MEYEPVIGLETHAQLLTVSKMFCRCRADYAAAPPNTLVCPVCLGLPGVLPVINRRAVEYTVMTALALNCSFPEYAKFDRKNYHYPDLPKGYQISQYDLPLSQNGWLAVDSPGGPKRIHIRRVHLEEDTAKLFHVANQDETYSLIDFNRAGVPLMEIVTEHDFASVDEVRQYIIKLRAILRYLGVCSGDMETGAMRFEANISLRPKGSDKYGTKVEVKNLNSFRAVLKSLQYEIDRQARLLQEGGRVKQETMGWDDVGNVTVVQRSKEEADDYRYFPEPDLPPLALSREWIESLRARLPELPDAKRQRLVAQYGITHYDAGILTGEKALADYFEACAARHPNAKAVANWITRDLLQLLNSTNTPIEACPVTPDGLAQMLKLMDDGIISSKLAKTVFEEMFKDGKGPEEIVAAQGLVQISDASQIESIVEEVMAANPRAVADFRAGKEPALTFLVGQVMKATRGRASPALANEILRRKLQ